MRITLRSVAKGPGYHALPPTTITFQTGQATLAQIETEQRPTVLGLIASGRMRPDAGSVTIDGTTDYSAMRKKIALIDAPDVCEPANDITVAGVTAEELMFAGRRSHPIAVNRTLRELDLFEYARQGIGTMPPTERIRLLCELALMRAGVEGLVITSPDRHGGDPNGWWALARELAERDLAVLVVAGDASAAAIAAAGLVDRIQSTERAVPQPPAPETPQSDSTDSAPAAEAAAAEPEQEHEDEDEDEEPLSGASTSSATEDDEPTGDDDATVAETHDEDNA